MSGISDHSGFQFWGIEPIANQDDESHNDSPRTKIVFSANMQAKDWRSEFNTDPSPDENLIPDSPNPNYQQTISNPMILSVLSNCEKTEKETPEKESSTKDNFLQISQVNRNDVSSVETKYGTDASQRSPM